VGLAGADEDFLGDFLFGDNFEFLLLGELL
jgi:hypothetical protein